MSKKKIIIIGIILVIVIISIIIFTNRGKKKEISNEVYWINESGEKINDSNGISATKTVDDLKIESTQITRNKTESILTAKVTNSGTKTIENVKFNVSFYDEEENLLAATTVLVGTIKQGEFRFINASIAADVSEATRIEYEIKK